MMRCMHVRGNSDFGPFQYLKEFITTTTTTTTTTT